MCNKKESNDAFLVDATGFVLKYWFSVPPIKTDNYESIAAFIGFASFVIKLLRLEKPKYISFAFDESLGTCFRNDIYKDYKRSRATAPEELKEQFKLCRNFLTVLGLDNHASRTYEADDILNTISKISRKNKIANIILTNDKDLYQLIYKHDVWWDYKSKKFTHEQLKNMLGFSPQDMSDYLGLMGDSVDNIPGAPGLGEKTASVLMMEYKNLENIFDRVETISNILGSKYKRFTKIIKDNKKIIYLSKKLATLEYIDNMKYNISDLKRRKIDFNNLEKLLQHSGMRKEQMNSWLKDIQELDKEII